MLYICEARKLKGLFEKIISKSLGFCWIKGFYKVVNFSSRHFSPLSLLKLFWPIKAFKNILLSLLIWSDPGQSREMRESMRWGNIPYRVLPRHSPGLINPREEANIYSIAALSWHFDKFTAIKLLIYNSTSLISRTIFPGTFILFSSFLALICCKCTVIREMNTSQIHPNKEKQRAYNCFINVKTLEKTLLCSGARFCDFMSSQLSFFSPCLMNGSGLLDINREAEDPLSGRPLCHVTQLSHPSLMCVGDKIVSPESDKKD